MGLDRRYLAIALVIGFVSWLLLTDRIPSLRWIPYAFTFGVLGTVLGLTYLVLSTSRGDHNEFSGRVQLATARPAFVSPKAWEEETASLKARAEYIKTPVLPHAKAVSRSLDEVLEYVLRDFVTSWYGKISRRPLFQNEVDRAIRAALCNIRDRLSNLDVVELGVSKIMPIITDHMKDFYNAERAVRGKNLAHTVTESEELDMAIASKFRNGKLHPAASLTASDTKLLQQSHLRSLVTKLLPSVMSPSMLTSAVVLKIVQEIVACAVLAPVMLMLCDPDTWNRMIEAYGRTMLHDRKTVKKLRAALDQHAPTSPRAARSTQFPRLRPYDSERQFERFTRAIRRCETLADGRRYRSEIMSQLRRDSAVEGQDPAYLRRLETGKRLLDQKMASLTTNGAIKPKLALQSVASSSENMNSSKRHASFRDLLYDASGLSYFMEHMDRHKLMRLVQFWIVVGGFRNPLEEDTDEPTQAPNARWSESERIDIAQMYEGYMIKPELRTSEQSLRAVREYLRAGSDAKPQEYLAARHAVLRTQTAVFEEMRDVHFESFKKSELYFKWLAIDDNPVLSASSVKSTTSFDSGGSAPERASSPARLRKPALTSSVLYVKEPELRRAVLSSSDLKASKSTSTLALTRRSFEGTGSRPALFDDDLDDERMARSVSSLMSIDSDVESVQNNEENEKVVDAMQAALNDIVEDEPNEGSLFPEPSAKSEPEPKPRHRLLEYVRPALEARPSEREKPSIDSLGLVSASSRRGVFINDLFGDEETFPEDEKADLNAADKADEQPIHEAAPGDLGLAEAIDAINAHVERLNAQRSIVNSLTRKAELTNNIVELRILRKSEQSLQREIHRKEMQKQQYVVQESDNSLYGRAVVSIKSVMVGREEDGHEYALYVIEVRRQAGNQVPAATWAVTRRYTQFHELHKRLRARFPAVRDMDFPRRQTLFSLQKDFLERRRIVLERYLRGLLLIPAICHTRELRAFLSQHTIASSNANGTQVDARDFVTRIYNSVSDGMEESIGNVPVQDQLSVAGQNLISAASVQMNGTEVDGMDLMTQDPTTAAEAEAELSAFESKEMEPFVKPICDLFLETFELQKGNNWLRGRTVVIVLHQLLGGTIERKARETVKNVLQDGSMARYIDLAKDTLWPGGKLRQAAQPRTAMEKTRTRKEARVMLATLTLDLAGSVVGKSHAQDASRKVLAMLNNQRLCTHLVFTVLDEIVHTVFPETLVDP